MEYWITADRFGNAMPDCRDIIADFLKGIIKERRIENDKDAVDELWEAFWEGDLGEQPSEE